MYDMHPIIIVGPTSSGKTSLSLDLAGMLHADIFVVDSKQVFKGQDVVTGKDIPENFPQEIFGLDIQDPIYPWSIAQFLCYAKEVLQKSTKAGKQLIIVGGTPQYLLSLFHPPESRHVPPNDAERVYMQTLSVGQLQEMLSKERLSRMNESDRKNPRRLIRAIEIETYPYKTEVEDPLLTISDCVWIGLRVQEDILRARIRRRVIDRIDDGAIQEYQGLFKHHSWSHEAKAAIGYAEIGQFVDGRITKDELIDVWTLHELQYARRQMQWWKRESQIEWFEAGLPDLANSCMLHIKKLLQ